ncbi:MAG TPA: hypothetical protein VIV63_14005, partial [Steroidobacteraceae bacterium]
MRANKILLTVTLATAGVGVHADVTINTTTSGKASIMDVSGIGVHQIKGARQRSDQTIGGKPQV